MLLVGATEQGMSHEQCLQLLESVEDTLDFFCASLSYLIAAEGRQPQPDQQLIAHWQAMFREAIDLQHSLPGAHVDTYKQIRQSYLQRSRELDQAEARYR